jgi:hypothetical protein
MNVKSNTFLQIGVRREVSFFSLVYRVPRVGPPGKRSGRKISLKVGNV